MRALTVGLIDDHPLMREAIVALLARSQGYKLVAVGMTKDILLIAKRDQPDVIIIDPGASAEAHKAIATAVKIATRTKFIVFGGATSIVFAIFALEAGASGYLTKVSGGQELVVAIEAIRKGETYITERFASEVIAGLRDSAVRRAAAEAVRLSRREEQVIKLLLRGTTNKEIGMSLGIGERTVKNYMTALMQKLHARNRVELVIAAQKISQGGAGAVHSAPAQFV
jgi:DNA-binding NarL/FixJ family response regulator